MIDPAPIVLCLVGLASAVLAQDPAEVRILGATKLDRIEAKSGGVATSLLQVAARTAPGEAHRAVVVRASGEEVDLIHVDFRRQGRRGDSPEDVSLRGGDIVYFAPRSLLTFDGPRVARVLDVVLAAKPSEATARKIWAHLEETIRAARDPRDVVWSRLVFVRRHPDIEKRVLHIHLLGSRGAASASAVPALVRFLEKGGRVAEEAVLALGMIGGPSSAALPKLEELAKAKIERVSKRASVAVEAIQRAVRAKPAVAGGGALVARPMGKAELARCKVVDSGNLRWQFQAIQNYKARYKTPPRGGGTKFILDAWVRRLAEHTPQNRDRFFSPAFADDDPHYEELVSAKMDELWKTSDDLKPEDTHYFGLRQQQKRGMWSGKKAWMCTPMYPDGTVRVLYGDGAVKELVIPAKERANWNPAKLGLTK